MSLTSRAKALRGVGFGALLLVAHGLLPVAVQPPVGWSGLSAPAKATRGLGYSPLLRVTHGLLPVVVSVVDGTYSVPLRNSRDRTRRRKDDDFFIFNFK